MELNHSINLGKEHNEKITDSLVGLGIIINTLCGLYFRNSKIDTSISTDIISLVKDELN